MKLLRAAFIVVVASCGGKKAVEPPVEPAGAAAPSSDVDRCARLLVITSKCGVVDDYEFGWIKSDVKPRTAAEATTECTVASPVDEDGMSAYPVAVLAPEALAKVEAASQVDCPAVFAALDEVDERIGPAGHDPSE
jgi:hypothetical protein